MTAIKTIVVCDIEATWREVGRLGQGDAASKLGPPAAKSAHRADDDAYETAQILCTLMRAQRNMIEGAA